MLFAYPQAAKFGRVIPKNKIYEHADARAALKERFVAEVDQITWAYKLAPETINLGGSDAVPEIQVFQVKQRGDTLSEDVLRAMDRAIPFPILFELVYGAKRRTVASFKRPNEGGKSKWVNRPGFAGEFFVQNLGDVIKSVYACVESFLHFLRRPIADGAM